MGTGIEEQVTCLACGSLATFEVSSDKIYLHLPDGKEQETKIENPSQFRQYLKDFFAAFKYQGAQAAQKFPTQGIWGYLGYDAARYLYPQAFAAQKKRPKDIPSAFYVVFQYTFVFEQQTDTLYIIENKTEHQSSKWDEIEAFLGKSGVVGFPFELAMPPQPLVPDRAFQGALQQAAMRCQRGEAYEVNIAQAFQAKGYGDIFHLYRYWRRYRKARYSFFWDDGDFQMAGTNENNHLFVSNNTAQITAEWARVARTDNEALDERLLQQLTQSTEIQQFMNLMEDAYTAELLLHGEEAYPVVHRSKQHLSRHLRWITKWQSAFPAGGNPVDWLLDCFPALPVTGVSREGALRMINELEVEPRDFYGGSFGFLGSNGFVQQMPISNSFLYNNQQIKFFIPHSVNPHGAAPNNNEEEEWNKALAMSSLK